MGFAIIVVVALLAVASPYLGIPDWTPALATISALSAVSLMGLNLIFGYCGMLVLGQAAFGAVASYACTMIFNAGAPSLVAIAIGSVTAIAAARLLAAIFIRLPGIYLAVGTLGFSYVTEGLIRALPGITGGASGLVLGSQLKLTDNAWYAIAVTVLFVAVLSMRWLLGGKLSRSLQLLQRDEMAAEVAGIDVARLKIRMFTIGAGYTAAGAVVLSQYVGVVSPEMGGATTSLEYLAMVIIGGAGSLMGPLVGSVIVHWLFAASGAAHEYELLIFGCCFLVIVLFAPRGVVGLFQKAFARLGVN
jgi:branched-chain amino acid transport system permease protein